MLMELKRGQRANPLRIIWMENEKDKLLKENGHCSLHSAYSKKENDKVFFLWKKRFFTSSADTRNSRLF